MSSRRSFWAPFRSASDDPRNFGVGSSPSLQGLKDGAPRRFAGCSRLALRARWVFILCGAAVGAPLLEILEERLLGHSEVVEAQGGQGTSKPIFRLDGPNDGEPINSRCLNLTLRTNFSEPGTIDISVNGIALQSRSLQLRSLFDPATGLYSSPIDIDLEAVQKRVPSLFNNPDAPPLEVTVVLHSSRGLVTFTSWVGYVGRPWLEFLRSSTDRNPIGRGAGAGQIAGPVPNGLLGIVLHPLSTDSYYFLVASSNTDLLKLHPENPRLLREGKVLAGEPWFVPKSEAPPRKVIVIDPKVVRETQVVLWTHSFQGGWHRSAVFTIPR